MCGIVGVFRYRDGRLASSDGQVLDRMAELLRHRGPDSQGQVLTENCALAGLRLSILDLSPLGAQPMASDDRRYWLVYNGEVYNYVELRTELEASGVRFRGGSDTEVVLRAYETWGEACFGRFVGMWALALFDAQRRVLTLSRDRFGIKPLYYYLDDQILAFASEIKAVVAFLRESGRPVRPAERSVATYVGTGLVDGLEETFFAGIRRFEPATLATCDASGLRSRTYWSLPAAAAGRREALAGWTENRVVDELAGMLGEAVRVHLRSDVPLGVCLSGGLDSSTVVGLAARHVDRVHTFTVAFEDGADVDERPFAEQVIAACRAEASVEVVRSADLLGSLAEMLWYLDEPTLAMGIFPQWHVMRLASQHVKVVLDGQGGDEVFGGYMPYYTQYLYQLARAADVPRFAREVLGVAARQGRALARRSARDALAMALRPPRRQDGLAPDGVLLKAELRPHVDESFNEWRLWPRVFDDWLNNVLYWELTKTRLPALLRYEDRLSMAFSIESRVPLLDHRLVEFVFALPSCWKIRDGWTKYALRRAMAGRLPPTVVWRRDKKGFPTPFGAWLRNGLGADVTDLLLTDGRRAVRFLDETVLRAMLQRHRAGQADHSWQLWRALSLEVWLERFKL